MVGGSPYPLLAASWLYCCCSVSTAFFCLTAPRPSPTHLLLCGAPFLCAAPSCLFAMLIQAEGQLVSSLRAELAAQAERHREELDALQDKLNW